MPKLTDGVKQEYLKIEKLRREKNESGVVKLGDFASSLISEVATLLSDYAKKHNYSLEIVAEIAEDIKDTAIVEGVCAAEGDFTNIEDWVLASKLLVFHVYKTMLNPKMEYDPEKALEYITSPNSGNEENQDEYMRWIRMLVQYMANGLDNENEQLSKGSNKRKNNAG